MVMRRAGASMSARIKFQPQPRGLKGRIKAGVAERTGGGAAGLFGKADGGSVAHPRVHLKWQMMQRDGAQQLDLVFQSFAVHVDDASRFGFDVQSWQAAQ